MNQRQALGHTWRLFRTGLASEHVYERLSTMKEGINTHPFGTSILTEIIYVEYCLLFQDLLYFN